MRGNHAGYAVEFIIHFACTGAVLVSAGTTDVLTFEAFVREVAPSSALHALDGLLLLLCRPRVAVTYAYAVSDQFIGCVHQCYC